MFKINGEILLLLGTSRRSTSQFFLGQVRHSYDFHVFVTYLDLIYLCQTLPKKHVTKECLVVTLKSRHVQRII